jgi:predicted RND superfamily exporter protein
MYAAQVQWQLNAASAKVGRLYFYLRGFRPISTEIKRNDAFIAQAEEKAIWFWNLVQTKTPPPMIEGRDKVVYDTPISNVDPTWLKRVEQLKEKNKRLVEMEKHIKAVKADIKQLEQYFTGQIPEEAKTFEKDGIRATRVERNGSVDYQQLLESIKSEMNIVIPESMIEKCRKEGTSYFKVTVSDNSTDSVSTQEKSETPEVEENTTVQNKPQELVKTAQVLTPKQLDSSELGYQPASKVTTQEEVKSTQTGEMVFPIPASNFFEKSNQSVFF